MSDFGRIVLRFLWVPGVLLVGILAYQGGRRYVIPSRILVTAHRVTRDVESEPATVVRIAGSIRANGISDLTRVNVVVGVDRTNGKESRRDLAIAVVESNGAFNVVVPVDGDFGAEPNGDAKLPPEPGDDDPPQRRPTVTVQTTFNVNAFYVDSFFRPYRGSFGNGNAPVFLGRELAEPFLISILLLASSLMIAIAEPRLLWNVGSYLWWPFDGRPQPSSDAKWKALVELWALRAKYYALVVLAVLLAGWMVLAVSLLSDALSVVPQSRVATTGFAHFFQGRYIKGVEDDLLVSLTTPERMRDRPANTTPPVVNQTTNGGSPAVVAVERGIGAPVSFIFLATVGATLFTIKLLVDQLTDPPKALRMCRRMMLIPTDQRLIDEVLEVSAEVGDPDDEGDEADTDVDGEADAGFEGIDEDETPGTPEDERLEDRVSEETASAGDEPDFRVDMGQRVARIVQHQFMIVSAPISAVFVYQMLVFSGVVPSNLLQFALALGAGIILYPMLEYARDRVDALYESIRKAETEGPGGGANANGAAPPPGQANN